MSLEDASKTRYSLEFRDMKKILITGADSYIGTSFEKYIKESFSNQYQVDTVDMIDGSWREKSFAMRLPFGRCGRS